MRDQTQQSTRRVVLITGPSGAGRSTAINVLEDLGFEAIDNLPLGVLPDLLGSLLDRPVAIGLDVRNRDFSVDGVAALLENLQKTEDLETDLLYLDCGPEVLARRFSETRRRHPMAPTESPEFGIAQEIELLAPLRDRATLLIDTSDLSPHDLRDELQDWYDLEAGGRMAISVQSFSYKRGAPAGVDIMLDCRFLKNPHWEPDLRPRDGRDPSVAAYVESDPLCARFFANIADMMELLLPAYREEGKSHLVIGLGCTGGRHRSVAIAEKLAKRLANLGWQASIRHRELERRARSVPPQLGDLQ